MGGEAFPEKNLVVGNAIRLQYDSSVYVIKSIEECASAIGLWVSDLQVKVVLEKEEPRAIICGVPMVVQKKIIIIKCTIAGPNNLIAQNTEESTRAIRNTKKPITGTVCEKIQTKPTTAGIVVISACIGAAARIGTWLYDFNNNKE